MARICPCERCAAGCRIGRSNSTSKFNSPSRFFLAHRLISADIYMSGVTPEGHPVVKINRKGAIGRARQGRGRGRHRFLARRSRPSLRMTFPKCQERQRGFLWILARCARSLSHFLKRARRTRRTRKAAACKAALHRRLYSYGRRSTPRDGTTA